MQSLINILGWLMLIQIVLLVVGLLAALVLKGGLHPNEYGDGQVSDPKAFLSALEELTSEQASWIALPCANEDAAKLEHLRAIDVNAEWTHWEDQRFFGETLEHAAREALKAKRAHAAAREASPA